MYVRVFSRGKTSRVVARLVNTRHPSTVDWGVNLPSKYIYLYTAYTTYVPGRNCQVTFGHADATHQYTDYATTGLIDSRPISRSLGSVPLFELFLFVFPSHRFCPTLWFLSSYSPSHPLCLRPSLISSMQSSRSVSFEEIDAINFSPTREIVRFPSWRDVEI